METGAATETASVAQPAVPRPGQLTPGWRYATAAMWFLVFVAYSGVWKASRELGLATWWLGPVSEPRPFFVMLLPFVGPAAMVLAALANARRLPWYGLAASGVALLIAIPDVDRVRRLGIVEVAIAVAAALVSVAGFAGTYRRGGAP
jgi:hypothetical protein